MHHSYNENYAPNDDQKKGQVEEDVEDVLKFEAFSGLPLVEDGVYADGDEQRTQQPEQQIEEEHGVLHPTGNVREVAGEASAASSVDVAIVPSPPVLGYDAH